MRAYVAAGWFTPKQEEKRLDVLSALEKAGIDFYSPKEDLLFDPKTMTGEQVLLANMHEIANADFVVASTEGKDMGTIWECGYAHALGIPVVYYFSGPGKFNLMLAASGIAVCDSAIDLTHYLISVNKHGLMRRPYLGEME